MAVFKCFDVSVAFVSFYDVCGQQLKSKYSYLNNWMLPEYVLCVIWKIVACTNV